MTSTRGLRLHHDDPVLIPGLKDFRNSNGSVDLAMVTVEPPTMRRAKPEPWNVIVANRRRAAKNGRRARSRIK